MDLAFFTLESCCSTGLFYLAYKALLSRSNSFQASRYFILAAMPLSFIIPLLKIGVYAAPDIIVDGAQAEAAPVAYENIATWQAGTDIFIGIIIIYALVTAWLLACKINGYTKLIRLSSRPGVKNEGGVEIHSVDGPDGNFSFFNHIFISAHLLSNDERDYIMSHETAHVRLRHSRDIVFMESVKVFFWWDPFVWLFSRALRETHEYQADRYAVSQKTSPNPYIDLIVKQSTGAGMSIVHRFGYSLTKKRLTMIAKRKNRGSSLRAGISFAAAMLAAMTMFSLSAKEPKIIELPTPVAEPQPVELSNTTSNQPAVELSNTAFIQPAADDNIVQQEKEKALFRAEVMPKFQGGDLNDFRLWFQNQIAQINRSVIAYDSDFVANFAFIVDEKGKLTLSDIDNSPNESFTKEIKRILSLSPDWTPGEHNGKKVKVKYSMPVKYIVTK